MYKPTNKCTIYEYTNTNTNTNTQVKVQTYKYTNINAQVKYGEEAWDNVRKMANIDTPTFSIHQVIFNSIRSYMMIMMIL